MATRSEEADAASEEGDTDSRPAQTGRPTKAVDPHLPVDKGWAWVILLAISVNLGLSFGFLRAYGVLFVEFLARFKASSSITALIMGTQTAFLSVGGFLVMNLAMVYFSVRTITICGGVIMFLGVLLTGFAPNIATLIVFQGAFIGLGCAMLQGPSLTLLNQYFLKRKALATSIATGGGTLGSVLIPIFMRWLLDHFGLQGAVLIFSGVVLHIVVFGSLLRPMEDYKRRSERRRKRQSLMQGLRGSGQANELTDEDNVVEASPADRLLDQNESAMEMNDISEGEFSDQSKLARNGSSSALPRYQAKHERSLPDRLAESAAVKYASSPDVPEASFTSLNTLQNTNESNPISSDREVETAISTADVGRDATPTCCSRCRAVFATMLDFRLLKRPVFWALLLHSMFGIMAAIMMVIYLPALAANKGVSKPYGALLLSINGVVTLVARPGGGFVADLLGHRRALLSAGFLFFCSVIGMFAPLYNSFDALVALSVLQGFFGAIFIPLVPVLMVDNLGVENLSKAIGFQMLFQGFFMTCVHPLCGLLSDVTGSYDAVFLFLGAAGLVSVLVLLLLPCATRLEKRTARDVG